MLKAIIFDFDGVIADTELDRFRYLQQQSKRYGYTIKDMDFVKIIGKRTSALLSELIPDMPENQIKEIATERKKYIKERIITIEPMPYLISFIK
jgi:beta-phosphoglucomutase